MKTEDGKTIPAYFLRAQEIARLKLEREKRERNRKAAHKQQKAQRLAEVLGEKSKEVRMDDKEGRIYFSPAQLEKLYSMVDKSQDRSMTAQFQLWDWLEAAFSQVAAGGVWAIGYEDGKLTKPYLFKKFDDESSEALQGKKQELEQRLAEINAKLKKVTIDELKSKMLTLMESGETLTLEKPVAETPELKLVPKEEAANAPPEEIEQAPAETPPERRA